MHPRTIDPQVTPLPLPERATFEVPPGAGIVIGVLIGAAMWAALIGGAWWLWTLIVR